MVAAEASGEAGRGAAWLIVPPTRGGITDRLTEACVARGTTFGTPLPKPFPLPTLADHLARGIRAAGCARVFVIGLSFGGQLAQALLQFLPERVAGLLLIASGAPDRARGAALRRSRWWWRWLPASRRLPREKLMTSDLEGAVDPAAFAIHPVPVEIVELGDDAVISAAESARLRALFPRASLAVVPGLGHDALFAWPDPLHAAVVAAMERLLSSPSGAPSR